MVTAQRIDFPYYSKTLLYSEMKERSQAGLKLSIQVIIRNKDYKKFLE